MSHGTEKVNEICCNHAIFRKCGGTWKQKSFVNLIALLLLIGFAFGGQPLFGYYYGAGDKKRLSELLHFCVCFISIIAAPPLTAAGCYPFGKYLPEKCPLADFVLNATMALTGTVKKFI